MTSNHLQLAVDNLPEFTNHDYEKDVDDDDKRSHSYCTSNLQQHSSANSAGSTCDSLTFDGEDFHADPETWGTHNDHKTAPPLNSPSKMDDASITDDQPLAREDMVFDWLSSFAGGEDDLSICSHVTSDLGLGSFLNLDDIAATNVVDSCSGFSIIETAPEFDNANLMMYNNISNCSTNLNVSSSKLLEIAVTQDGQYRAGSTTATASNTSAAPLFSDVRVTVNNIINVGSTNSVSMKTFVSTDSSISTANYNGSSLRLQNHNNITSRSSSTSTSTDHMHVLGKVGTKRARSAAWLPCTTGALNYVSFPASDSSSFDSARGIDVVTGDHFVQYASPQAPAKRLHTMGAASWTMTTSTDSKDGSDISATLTPNSSPVSLSSISCKVSPDSTELGCISRCPAANVDVTSSVDVPMICSRKLEFRPQINKSMDEVEIVNNELDINNTKSASCTNGCTEELNCSLGGDDLQLLAGSVAGYTGTNTSRTVEQQQQQQLPRRCSHCQSQKTPQWRAGPLGPKTLCNACGVRFKSGRLFEEYRPAKSPTFLSYKHSNSHKKVLEMRRRKGCASQQQQQVSEQRHSATTNTSEVAVQNKNNIYDNINNYLSDSNRSSKLITSSTSTCIRSNTAQLLNNNIKRTDNNIIYNRIKQQHTSDHHQHHLITTSANPFDDQLLVVNKSSCFNNNSSTTTISSGRPRYCTQGNIINDVNNNNNNNNNTRQVQIQDQHLQLVHLPHDLTTSYNGASLLQHRSSDSTFIC